MASFFSKAASGFQNFFGGPNYGALQGLFGGGGGGSPYMPALGPAAQQYQQYQGYLPPSGYQLAPLGLSGTAQGRGIETLTGIKGVQLADFLSSLNLQRQLTPLQAQLEMDLAGQLVPAQMQQLAGFQGLEQSLLRQSPAFAQQYQNFDAGQAGAFALGGAIPQIGQNIQGLQGGIASLLEGGLPQGIGTAIQDSLYSTAAQFGLERSPAALQDVSGRLGTSLAQIQSQLLGSYAGASGSLVGQGSSLLGNLFGAASQMAPGFGSLLGSTGLPDIGFGPIGFGGAADIYGKTLSQFQQANQNKKNTYAGYGNMATSLVGKILGGLGAGGYF